MKGLYARFKFFPAVLLVLSLSITQFHCSSSRKAVALTVEYGKSERLLIDSTITPDPDMEAFLKPYREQVNATMNVVIGRAAVDLTEGRPESRLGNFVADLMRRQAEKHFPDTVHVAITNYGGLRVDIPAGNITLGKVYELMPFENELVVVKLTGEQLIQLAREIGAVGGECISGMRLIFLDDRLKQATVLDREIRPEKIYNVVTTDYLSAPGRERLKTLSEGEKIRLGVKLRDAILEEIKEWTEAGKAITAELDGRIQFQKSGKMN